MPAKITIQNGIAAGTSHWIEKPVIRIGSAPTADVCVPSATVSPHAITLEYRDGQYRIYNRSQANIVVGEQAIPPQQSAIWQTSEIVQLNDVALRLDTDLDPTPMTMISSPVLEDEYQEESSDDEVVSPQSHLDSAPAAAATDNSKFWVQLAVTVLCLLGCVVLLARESLKDNTVDRRTAPNFTQVVRQATAAQTKPELIRRLQHAESAMVRGNKKTARERFGRLRDDLVLLRDKFRDANQASELAIVDLVEYRLGQLE